MQDNIDLGTAKAQEVLDKFNELSLKLAENLSDAEMEKVTEELSVVQDKIDAGNMWEIDRMKQRAMDALRCPPPDQDVSVLSGESGDVWPLHVCCLKIMIYSCWMSPPIIWTQRAWHGWRSTYKISRVQ